MRRPPRRALLLAAPLVPLIACALVLGSGLRSARADPTSCDTCLRTYPCDRDVTRCFTECQGRYPDAPVSLDNCIQACNTTLNICLDQAQVECALSRKCS